MNTVQQLEKDLEVAKKQSWLDQVHKDIQIVQEQYIGKCWGNRTFNAKSRSKLDSAISYDAISILERDAGEMCLRKGDVVLVTRHIGLSRNAHYRDELTGVNYSSSLRKIRLVNILEKPDYTKKIDWPHYNIGSGWDNKAEVSPQVFDLLWAAGDDANTMILEAFNKQKSLLPAERISMGDSRDSGEMKAAMDTLCIEVIDLTTYMPLFQEIQYKKLPGVHEGRWLVRGMAKAALEYAADSEDKRAEEWSGYGGEAWRQIQACRKSAEVIRSYIPILNL